MFKFPLTIACCVVIATPLAAQTVDATAPATATVIAPKRNAMIVTADGRRLGRVDTVRSDSAIVIYNGQFVTVPVSTLKADGARFVTSKSLAQLVR